VELLEKCTDFENSESNLQMIARKLGVRAERTPKFHCEMAGEGIEYNWAIRKKKYRSIPLIHKKGRQTFQDLVQDITAWESVSLLSAKRTSARARAYISSYYNLHFDGGSLLEEEDVKLTGVTQLPVVVGNDLEDNSDATIIEQAWKPAIGEMISMDIIEKLKKKYHSHRGVNSFETGSF